MKKLLAGSSAMFLAASPAMSAPTPKAGEPRPKEAGGLSADEVGKVIRRHWSDIKACYEAELAKVPALAGTVSLSFVIDPIGGVTGAKVSETTLRHAAVEQCMVAKAQAWQFPPPKGGGTVEVNYPFVFQAQ